MEDKYFESTVAALVANHHEFTAVNLAGHDLKGDRPSRLAEALAKNTHIDTFELPDVTGVTTEGWVQIIESLPAQLHTLDLSSCGLGSTDVFSKHLTPALSRLHLLAELDLSSNNATLTEDFFKAISHLDHLSELLLQHNSIGSESAIRLMQSIHPSAPISRVWLQNNEIEQSARDAINHNLAATERHHPIQVIFGS